ncbi:hypothetical protein [Acinetobacter baumannii]|uniref:hypothetical protein n=1 Tax=Acinetobacter baumannii TaxID=470 RepID=UPI0024B7E384|nr:hypothetical protein [Acinetobacter baumannii]MDI9759668.1 hypothetical protein [Acinetobacter baumannii]
MAIRADDSGFLLGERRLSEINQGMNKVEEHTSEILAILKGLMVLDNNERERNFRQLNTISSAVVSMARARPTVKVTVNAGSSKVTRNTSSDITVGATAGNTRTKETSKIRAGEGKPTRNQTRPIAGSVRRTDGVNTRESQPGRDAKGRFVAKANNINDINFSDAVKRGVDLSKLGLNADVSHIDPTVDAVRELSTLMAPAQRAFSFMGRGATWLFRKGKPRRAEDIPRAQQDHYTDVDRHNSEERKLLRKLIDAVNRQGNNGLADLLGKLGLAGLMSGGGSNGGNSRNRRNRRNGGRGGPIPLPVPDRDRSERRNPEEANNRNRGRGRLGRLGGKLGRFAGRIPLVGSLLGGAMLASEWGEMNNQERGGSIGSMVGGGIGGAIGSFAGPVGTVAGATVGSWVGDTIGQKVGQWTDKLQRSDIGGTILKTWNDTLEGINKMVKGTWSTAQLGLGMGGMPGMGGGFMLASFRRGGAGGGGGGVGPGPGASGGTPSSYNPNNEIPITKVLETGAGYNVVQLADGSVIKQEGTWNWRNRNPGNIEDGKFAKSRGHLDLTDAEGNKGSKRFAAFPTFAAGRKAKKELLFESSGYKDLDMMAAIEKYAPRHENNTRAYQQHVLKAVGSNKRMSEYTAEEREKFLNAIEQKEGLVPGKVTVIKPPTKTYNANQQASPQPNGPGAAPKKQWVNANGATPANQTKPLYVSNSPSVTPTNIPEAPNVLRRENSKPQPMLMASTANDVISQNPADRDIVHATTGGLGARPLLA